MKVNVIGVVKGQGHMVGPVSSCFASFLSHISQINNPWDTAISKSDLEKSKVKIMGELKSQRYLLINATAVTLGHGHGKVIQYIS